MDVEVTARRTEVESNLSNLPRQSRTAISTHRGSLRSICFKFKTACWRRPIPHLNTTALQYVC